MHISSINECTVPITESSSKMYTLQYLTIEYFIESAASLHWNTNHSEDINEAASKEIFGIV